MIKEDVKVSNKHIFLRKKVGNIFYVDESKNNKDTENYLIIVISKTNICKKIPTPRGFRTCPYSQNASGARNILTFVMARLIDSDDISSESYEDTFVNKVWSSNLFKMCFRDGYYDFKSKSFKTYDNETFTTTYIKRDFPAERDYQRSIRKII